MVYGNSQHWTFANRLHNLQPHSAEPGQHANPGRDAWDVATLICHVIVGGHFKLPKPLLNKANSVKEKTILASWGIIQIITVSDRLNLSSAVLKRQVDWDKIPPGCFREKSESH